MPLEARDVKTAVIMNPRSANGKTGRTWQTLEALARERLGPYTLFATERPGHAQDLTRAALLDGYERIVSAGGDGTIHEVVNGFFEGEKAVSPHAQLAVLPMGTGSDLARMLALPPPRETLCLMEDAVVSPIDIGRARVTTDDGKAILHFVNAAHAGMGGEVANRVNRTTKAFGGFASFLWGVVATMMTYRNQAIRLDVDGETVEGRWNDIVLANGKYDGGGMLIAPEAELDSGCLEIYAIGDVNRRQAFANLPRLYKGTLGERPDLVRFFRARRLVAESDETVLVNLDGEQPGRLPATLEVVPGAINLLLPRTKEILRVRSE